MPTVPSFVKPISISVWSELDVVLKAVTGGLLSSATTNLDLSAICPTTMCKPISAVPLVMVNVPSPSTPWPVMLNVPSATLIDAKKQLFPRVLLLLETYWKITLLWERTRRWQFVSLVLGRLLVIQQCNVESRKDPGDEIDNLHGKTLLYA